MNIDSLPIQSNNHNPHPKHPIHRWRHQPEGQTQQAEGLSLMVTAASKRRQIPRCQMEQLPSCVTWIGFARRSGVLRRKVAEVSQMLTRTCRDAWLLKAACLIMPVAFRPLYLAHRVLVETYGRRPSAAPLGRYSGRIRPDEDTEVVDRPVLLPGEVLA